MSKKRGSLLSYRPDIKVVDATLRDGGLMISVLRKILYVIYTLRMLQLA